MNSIRSAVCFILLLFPFSSWAIDYSPNSYKAYSGNYNQDSYADLILKALPQMNIVDMDGNYIVFETEGDSIVFLGQADGSFQILYPADKNILAGLALSSAQHKVYHADLDGDGKIDLAVQGHTASQTSFVSYGDDARIRVITENDLGIAPHAGSVEWAFSDLNSDGIDDLEIRAGGTTQAVAYGGSQGELSFQQYDSTQTPAEPGVLVGNLPASASVSSAGSSSINIPIAIPPGVNGLEPNLSITYSSQGGNGLLGVGASLSGLSAITRCGANLYDDEFIDPIDYDTNDNYCLDGDRLVPAEVSGEYRTKNNSAVRIKTLHDGSTPYFKVYFAGGRYAEYGKTASAREHQVGAKSPVHTWWMSSLRDRTSNAIVYHYNGRGLLNAIQYDAPRNQTGSSGNYRINIIYENRPDNYLGYSAVNGPYKVRDQRISQIEIKPGAFEPPLETYQMGYTTDSLKRSTLHYVQRCDASDQCLPATRLHWNNPIRQKVVQAPSFKNHISNFVDHYRSTGWTDSRSDDDISSRFKLGDFDGNGLPDVYWVEGSETNVDGRNMRATRDTIFLNQGDGNFTKTTGLMTLAFRKSYHSDYNYQHAIDRLIIGDFNGDSLSDVYIWGEGEGIRATYTDDDDVRRTEKAIKVSGHDETGYVYLSKGDGTFKKAGRIPLRIAQSFRQGRLKTGDFDGDGITDIAFLNGNNSKAPISIYLMDQQGQVRQQKTGPSHYVASLNDSSGFSRTTAMISVQDVNRDGISDIYQFGYNGSDTVYLFDSDGNYQSAPVTGFPRQYTGYSDSTDYNRVHFVDLNSDGFMDIYEVVDHTSGHDKIYLGKGNGGFKFHGHGINSIVGSNYWIDVARVKFADMNGDGLVDLYYVNGWTDTKEDMIYYNQTNRPGTFGPAEHSGIFTYVPGRRDGRASGKTSAAISGVQLLDMNGDGAADIHRIPLTSYSPASEAYEGVLHFWNNESQLVDKVVDGLGKTTQFS